jgi:hypothetical protein
VNWDRRGREKKKEKEKENRRETGRRRKGRERERKPVAKNGKGRYFGSCEKNKIIKIY